MFPLPFARMEEGRKCADIECFLPLRQAQGEELRIRVRPKAFC